MAVYESAAERKLGAEDLARNEFGDVQNSRRENSVRRQIWSAPNPGRRSVGYILRGRLLPFLSQNICLE